MKKERGLIHLSALWITTPASVMKERASEVDYLIVEETIYEKILNFRVVPPKFDSKHSLIVATFKSHTKLQAKKENCSTHQKPINGIAIFPLSSKF